jgi:hypothetical protein
VTGVARFIVETYAPQDGATSDQVVATARHVATMLDASGGRVRHVRSYVVPSDEQCFHAFEAESPDDLRRAARLAGIDIERIVEAVDFDRER